MSKLVVAKVPYTSIRGYPGSIKPPGNFSKSSTPGNFPKLANPLMTGKPFGNVTAKHTPSMSNALQDYKKPQALPVRGQLLAEKYKHCCQSTVVGEHLNFPQSLAKPSSTNIPNMTITTTTSSSILSLKNSNDNSSNYSINMPITQDDFNMTLDIPTPPPPPIVTKLSSSEISIRSKNMTLTFQQELEEKLKIQRDKLCNNSESSNVPVSSKIPQPPTLPTHPLVKTKPMVNNNMTLQKELNKLFESRGEKTAFFEKLVEVIDEKVYINKTMAEFFERVNAKTSTIITDFTTESEIILKGKGWTNENTIFLKKLREHINCHELKDLESLTYISRTMQETRGLLLLKKEAFYNNIWGFDMLHYLIQDTNKTLFTKEQYTEKIQSYKEAQELLKNHGHTLPNIFFLEILRRIGIIHNNDAIYSDIETQKAQIYIEGEGFVIKAKIYDVLQQNAEKYRLPPIIIFTEEQKEEILNNIKNKKYVLRDFLSGNTTKLLESGEERHLNIVTKYTHNYHMMKTIAFGCLTSNKDNNTFYIARKQYCNDEILNANKQQRGRIYKQAIFLNEEQLNTRFINKTTQEKDALQKQRDNFDLFITSENFSQENIHKNVFAEVAKIIRTVRDYGVREPYVFDRGILNALAQDNIQSQLSYLETIYNEKNSKSIITQAQEANLDQQQSDNFLRKQKQQYYRGMLPEERQKLLVLEEQLTEKKKIDQQMEKAMKKKKNLEELKEKLNINNEDKTL